MTRFDPEGGPFLNAHCHLELGHLRGKVLLPAGTGFVPWLQQIVTLKRTTDPAPSTEAARQGLARLRETGTTALLDIMSLGTSEGPLREAHGAGMQVLGFRELIAFESGQAADAVARTMELAAPGFPVGLSPHAPYTTSPALLREAARAARAARMPLCIHAAETAEEGEFLRHGTGPLRDFLDGALPEDWTPPGLGPIELLYECGCLGPGTLLVHVNHATGRELRLLAETGTRAVVCPGTHTWFGRGEFPLRRLMEAGVDVYLGTDSLASNENLDMAREIRLAVELTPGVDPMKIARLADAGRAGVFFG